METDTPCLFVAGKADQPEVRQDHEMQPSEFCHLYKLPPPQGFSCVDTIAKEVYVKLATMAAFP